VTAFLCLLVEDWADEGLWRPAMYYRWQPDLDAAQLSLRFSYEFLDSLSLPLSWLLPRALKVAIVRHRQWLFSVFGEGIKSRVQHGAVQAQYLSTLAALQAVLSGRPFLLGPAGPSRADFGLMGPLLRHCTALHCIALHCTALHGTALHCIALHCTALHCTALHCTALQAAVGVDDAADAASWSRSSSTV
jgi:hypothetical protein